MEFTVKIHYRNGDLECCCAIALHPSLAASGYWMSHCGNAFYSEVTHKASNTGPVSKSCTTSVFNLTAISGTMDQAFENARRHRLDAVWSEEPVAMDPVPNIVKQLGKLDPVHRLNLVCRAKQVYDANHPQQLQQHPQQQLQQQQQQRYYLSMCMFNPSDGATGSSMDEAFEILGSSLSGLSVQTTESEDFVATPTAARTPQISRSAMFASTSSVLSELSGRTITTVQSALVLPVTTATTLSEIAFTAIIPNLSSKKTGRQKSRSTEEGYTSSGPSRKGYKAGEEEEGDAEEG